MKSHGKVRGTLLWGMEKEYLYVREFPYLALSSF
jgi:hypothetical protein